MERLGLGHEALRARNPRLVYCAISGFGQDGPLAQRPAYDQIIQGLSGVMSVTGDERSAPLRVGYPVCDTIGGLTAAFAVCAALLRARASGEGSFVDVSMLDATLATMGWVVSNYLNAGVVPRPIGNDNFTAAPSGTFRTGNGLLNIAANEDRQFEALCRVVGAPDLATDARFAEREARKRHRAELTACLEPLLASRSAADWETILEAAGVPAGRRAGPGGNSRASARRRRRSAGDVSRCARRAARRARDAARLPHRRCAPRPGDTPADAVRATRAHPRGGRLRRRGA